MQAIISALKEEVEAKGALLNQIAELSANVNRVDDNYLFSPKPGKLFELLHLLRENHVNYNTDFKLDDEIAK